MKYKIELRYFYGWDEAGWTDENEDEIKPTHFETVADAESALQHFLNEVSAAVRGGGMGCGHDRDEYRIVRVSG